MKEREEGESHFDRNVFINCPFDEAYFPLLRPLLFTVIYLDFNPRIASERSDSMESRIDKISGLIRGSGWSIHDLSRLKATEAGEFYRMNCRSSLALNTELDASDLTLWGGKDA